jgi:sterol desaturase/sphingolipid hydroxylase (fatty acid hydroxylase superfamily)
VSRFQAGELALRSAAFVAVFASLALGEALAPRRALRVERRRRWSANLGLAALNTLGLRLLAPASAVGAAALAAERGWGLLAGLALPAWAALPLSVLLLDLAVYLQHLVLHAAPTLWRLHLVHHADLDFDVTTGLRFHPFEIGLSLLYKVCVVAALGPPVLGVLLFEALLNATSMFSHANLRLPERLDRILRTVLVTPDMHRVHHSVRSDETNRNFGFCLSWWDRLFGTYRAQPRIGHGELAIGLAPFQNGPAQTLGWLLALPLREAARSYPMGSRDDA